MTAWSVLLDGSYEELGRLARGAEAAGCSRVWVPETHRNVIVQVAHLVHHTTSVGIGTNIALAFPRSPTIMATAAWDLAELSGDRFVLGLGSQVRRIIEDRYSAAFDRPAARMAEYLQAMRAIWDTARGENSRFEGEIYRVTMTGSFGRPEPGHPVPRVQLAAVGPLMVEVAGRYADGWLGHPLTSRAYLERHVLGALESSLDRAARARAAFTVTQGLIVSVGEDAEQARREAKQQIAFYGTTPNYRPVFDAEGDAELTDILRAAWKTSRRDPRAIAEAVPDECVDRYAVAGTPGDVRDRLAEWAPLVDEVVLTVPWYGVPEARRAENLGAILAAIPARVPGG